MVQIKETGVFSEKQKFDILKKGIPITDEYDAFNAEELLGMESLTKVDYLRNLLHPSKKNFVSQKDLELYVAIRKDYLERTPIERLAFVAKNTKLVNPKKVSLDSLNDLPLELFSKYLEIEYPAEKRFRNSLFWDEKVATPDQIITDLTNPVGFELIPRTLTGNLTPRAIVGHAQQGHCEFHSNIRPNTTLDDIITDEVLSQFKNKNKFPYYNSAEEFLIETQKYINNFAKLVDMALEPSRLSNTVNDIDASKLLFDFNFLKGIPVDLYAFIKGVAFGGSFDNYEDVRKPVFDRYGVEMGGGRTRLINKKMMKGLGLNINSLTKIKYKDPILKNLSGKKRMDLFLHYGLLKKDDKIDYKNSERWQDVLSQAKPIPKGYVQEYVRETLGPGGSDDILCMAAAWLDFKPSNVRRNPLWYFWLQMGARAADFVDTLTKASQFYLPGGQDEAIAKFANARWLNKLRNTPYYSSNLGVDIRKLEKNLELQGTEDYALILLDELIDMTAIGINPSKVKFPSGYDSSIHSSARYFSKAQETDIDYTNFNNSQFAKGVTTAMDQQFYAAHKYLKKAGADVTYGGKFIHPLTGQTEIGFQKHPLNIVITYFNKEIFPVISKPTKRKELLTAFFNTYYKKTGLKNGK